MSKISISDVKKIAKLSGLNLSDDEAELYRTQFETILGYIEQLNDLDIAGIEPTYQVTGLKNVTRADEVINYGVSTEELLKNAPETEANQIKVRRVLG